MRLYPLQGASSVQHEDHGSFDVDPETGAVEVPHELGEHLHATHIGGAKAWETEAERHARLVAEEIERRRDPASMFDLMQQAFGAADPAVPVLPEAPVIVVPADGEEVTLVNALGLVVTGTAVDGTITVYDGETVVGAAVSQAGEWSATLMLGDGPHVLSACVTVNASTSEWAAPVSITVKHITSQPMAEPEPTEEPKTAPAKKAPAKKAPAKKPAATPSE